MCIIATWHVLVAPLLPCLSKIKIRRFSIELVVSRILRLLKVENMASRFFDTMNTLLFLLHISYYEIMF